MTFEAKVTAAAGEWAQAHKPVVVAVDGSERNRSAVSWAAHEAAATGSPLHLVTAAEDHIVSSPHRTVRPQDEAMQGMLEEVRGQVHAVAPEVAVHPQVVAGAPTEVLLAAAEGSRMLVVGKRGLGTFGRLIVGSTSVAVAGRSPVPVAVVPAEWAQEDHQSSPVVVGIDPEEPDHTQVHVAFTRAERLGVPVLAVHGWESPTAWSLDVAAVATELPQWEQEAKNAFEQVVDGWQERFPDVKVTKMHRRLHPANAVLDAAEGAQLIVLGRHRGGRRTGFGFGSVARAVLHYSETPALVVPAPEA